MIYVVSALVFLAVAVGMEGVAWAMHKYVMHGFLWVLHEDHHHPRGRGLQKNDLFAVFFAVISIGLIYDGVFRQAPVVAAAGLGMALYGAGYVSFHDIMFHRRVRWLHLRPRGRYLQRIVHAHSIHHRSRGRTGAESFSFLWAPKKYDVASG